ncbi:MAG: hypothetical protein B6241_09085 [Spirochaetaceae bacterium 4572_59]|nr:MAG: hypothetical protein B6241_09085 [Spirochaetaceae bacterium 4572_59]
MSDNRKLFIKILRVELEEIENDINLLIELYQSRYEKHEITHYVQQENGALLEREISCLKKLLPVLSTFPTEEYQDNESFIAGLKVFLDNFVKENQFPHAVFLLAEHKIQKVVKYIF